MIFMKRAAGPPVARGSFGRYHQRVPVPTMSLRLKINLIVASLTILFTAMVMALQLRSMRESVHEEVVAAIDSGELEADRREM